MSEIEKGKAAPARPLAEILGDRNPLVHCHDLAMQHQLTMIWEQLAEDGPAHDKIFTWKLQMREFEVVAASKTKKGAQTLCGEKMAIKLEAAGLKRGGKKRKAEEEEVGGAATLSKPAKTARVTGEGQKSPISELYELCSRRGWPEPAFVTLREKVLKARRTRHGNFIKKTEFTVQCTVLGKRFPGTGLKKKEAKTAAAEAALEYVQVGI